MKSLKKTVLFAKNFYLQQELRGITDFARNHGWQLEMPQMYGLPGHVRSWRGAGLLTDTPYYTDRLSAEGVKVVGLSLSPGLQEFAGAVVAPDNERIGIVGAEYFLRRGFRNFAVCEDCFGRDTAFRNRIGQEGYHAERIAMPRYFRSPRALSRIAAKLASLPLPCCVFCNNDWEAASIINAADTAGIPIPEKLAVIGVGNEELICSTTSPPISSIDTRLYLRGFRAAEELDRLMEGAPRREEPIEIAPGEVVERSSSNSFAVTDPKLRNIIRHLQNHAATPVQIMELARRFRMSESRIYRLFQEELSISPKEFLTEIRLNLARTRLLDTDDTVGTIAQECGFPSPGALFDLFRERYGQTPTEWRSTALSGTISDSRNLP